VLKADFFEILIEMSQLRCFVFFVGNYCYKDFTTTLLEEISTTLLEEMAA
jgi:hypothetical protein